MRFSSACLFALSAILIAACGSDPAPIRQGASVDLSNPVVRPESGQVRAANVKRLYPNKRLFVCAGINVSNKPDINRDNEVIQYSRLVVVRGPGGDVPLVTAPANNACMSSGFGPRWERNHNGIDITSNPASRVFSGAKGTVLEAGYNSGYGLSVLMDHGNGVYTRYGHLARLEDDIKPGAVLVYGHPIGLMGSTGKVTGVHLHYEILTGRYQPGIKGRGLTPHNPFDYPAWVDKRLEG